MAIGTLAAIGLAAAGAGSVISASKQAKAAKKAANVASDTSLQVAREDNELAKFIYGENKATLAPWQTMGLDAAPRINAMLDLLPGGAGAKMGFDAYKGSTGYDARLQEGMDAIRGSFSGNGTLQSGAALKGLVRYGQDYASNEFGNYVNSLMPRLNSLTGTRDLGFNAAGAQTGVATNYSGQVMANNQNAADTKINAALYKAQNTTSPFGNALSLVGGGLFGMGR